MEVSSKGKREASGLSKSGKASLAARVLESTLSSLSASHNPVCFHIITVLSPTFFLVIEALYTHHRKNKQRQKDAKKTSRIPHPMAATRTKDCLVIESRVQIQM